ncbi:MAG: hypothetical protein WBE89_06325 [Methyloceanibacter sp.]|jgi:hypothetical protein
MKSLLMGLVLVACITSAEAAEAWTCSYVEDIGDEHLTQLIRFDVSPPEVTADLGDYGKLHFRIVQNDDTGLVATASQARNLEGQKNPWC